MGYISYVYGERVVGNVDVECCEKYLWIGCGIG